MCLGVVGRENPQTKRFLVQFKKMHTLWSIDSQEKLVKLVPPDVRF